MKQTGGSLPGYRSDIKKHQQAKQYPGPESLGKTLPAVVCTTIKYCTCTLFHGYKTSNSLKGSDADARMSDQCWNYTGMDRFCRLGSFTTIG